jgi:hypothetical protein
MKECFSLKPRFSAFLSASTDPNDKKVVKWFSNLLEEFDIEPIFATHYPQPRPPQEKIEDFIGKSDMFVAVLTRRDKIEGKNLWTGPEWIQNEIAIALTLKKPIALFVEERVQINRSIVPFIGDHVPFHRRKLDSVRNRAERFIMALCDEIETHVRPLPKEKVIDQTIVEESEESMIDRIIIDTGRRVLLWRYGRLDVSLRRVYIVTLLLLLIPSYFAYDYFVGIKIAGYWGGTISLLVIIIMILILYAARATRCRECKSYFSERSHPITYGDLKKFPELPKNRKLLKYVCEVCGNIRYDTKERTDE